MPKSPRQMRKEIQEAVTEQVRDLPIHAVRLAMFGVGRALLLSDRVSRDYREIRESGVRPVLGRLRDDARHASTELAGKVVGKVVHRVNGSATGGAETVEREEIPVARPPRRPAGPTTEIATSKPKVAPVPEAETGPEAKADEAVATEPQVAPVAEPETVEAEPKPARASATADLPVPGYDTATLASVRARLRALSAAQVSKLREYEQEHDARPDFLRMYDNRIAKLANLS